MKRILRIGMDVHSTNYTLCAMESIIGEDDRIFDTIDVAAIAKELACFMWGMMTDNISPRLV